MNLNEIYTEVITEHSTSARNRRHLEQASVTLAGKNPSCGDEIELELLVRDGKIADASFTGVGCAISQASASMMIDLVRGKSLPEARQLAELFTAMIQRKVTNDRDLEPLEEAAALKSVSNLPARVKCAAMPWHTLETAIEGL
ncbi:Fe-S cluster assembly sulfur transfer protein SufU [Ruminiclostridium cellobioparum]|uniref:SUF system FeS assembly protein, NifU family n=1 Tax=Ruminiclostridium cellobioparum subsp. termitidis CT1112 TaxID=1195236 RepID=S0FW58_RUMCE|nr:SUF system NifU family Fe-S cluster assembly protein [Ruminiclostridium cellobioparum]EMS73399.1 SUF system FeS assembly protein, NifU family [Ruminiclostridium cellobioparum subsp. termitidis CT1112]